MLKKLKCKHGNFIFFEKDLFVGKSLNTYGEFSEGEIHLFNQLLLKGDNIIEVGSNIGTHTIPLSRIVSDTGKIYAFEPQKEIYKILKKNLLENDIRNIVSYQKGVSSKNEIKFISGFNFKKEGNFGDATLNDQLILNEGHKVEIISIDNLLYEEFEQKKIKLNFLKCDTQGSDVDVLKGSEKIIKKHHPLIYVENELIKHSEELIELLLSYGYILHWHIVPLFNPLNYFKSQINIFERISSFNMLCMHVSNKISLNISWKNLRIRNSKFHPLK